MSLTRKSRRPFSKVSNVTSFYIILKTVQLYTYLASLYHYYRKICFFDTKITGFNLYTAENVEEIILIESVSRSYKKTRNFFKLQAPKVRQNFK